MVRFVTPQLGANSTQKQWQQKHFYKGNRNITIDLYNGVRVYVRNYNRGRPWVDGVVQSKTSPLSYTIKLEDERVVKRHLDQIQKPYNQKHMKEVNQKTY